MIINKSSFLKLIGDQSRLELLLVLDKNTFCVSEIIQHTGLSQSLISHHLRDLKDGGLVECQRNGKWVYYSLTHKGIRILSAIKIFFQHSNYKQTANLSPFLKLVADKSRLKILSVLQQNTFCVSELIGSTGLSQSLISHHLRDLKDEGLVKAQRNGKWVYYDLIAKGQQALTVLGESM